MKVAAYIMVSNDEQCSDDQFSLEFQEKQISEYAKKNGMRIIRWFRDEVEDGAKERQGFDVIMYGDVSNPPIEAVIVAKPDRIASSINVYYYYNLCLLKKGIKLISISEDFEAFGDVAPILEAFTICVAQMERESLYKRTSAGRRAKANIGGYSGGRAPYGYAIQNHALVIESEEAKIVKRIFFMREEIIPAKRGAM